MPICKERRPLMKKFYLNTMSAATFLMKLKIYNKNIQTLKEENGYEAL